MNEFIEQFIIECRDYIEQATSALQTLENYPDDAEALDALFRALHTLKGGAGIVDFAAMERALHAAESALGHARAGDRNVSTKLNADLLACLDLVVRWLDEMERTGELPERSDAQAEVLLHRLSEVARDAATAQHAAGRLSPAQGWLEGVLANHQDVGAYAQTAIRFIPKRDSFLRGEDPIALMGALPGLLALDLQPDGEWPALDVLDPYECILILLALTSASTRDVSTYLKNHVDECEIIELDSAAVTNVPGELPQSARDILEAQTALLNDVADEAFAGTITSVGMAAANVLVYCGHNSAAERITYASSQSLAEGTTRYLQEQLVQALRNPIVAEVSQSLPAAPARADIFARTLRVDAERVETLVRLIGEMTVVKNAIGHVVNLAHSEANPLATILKGHHGVLDRITGDVQRTVLGMRVLPLRTVLGRFGPVIRDMSANLGKPVKLAIEGDETEADKAIVEMLFEPLLHIVRNAMDHGIESPAIRALDNKPATASIVIRASRQSDRVFIEVSDDGGGINVARIREVALERGVVSSERLAELSEAEIIDLIFAPGFSTAAQVTELSGRGVGMDAVRMAVGRMGGMVAIESQSGQGTTVRFSLPFSVMMTHVMTVEAGGQTFGIPIDAVIETIRVPVNTIAEVGSAQVIVHRNRTLPVFDLTSLLQVQSLPGDDSEAVIVVAAFAGQWGGIRVERAGERMEVMLKPLEGLLSSIPGVTGTTIMGDGQVLLVLDLGEILL
ncbi:MAG: chemotaxis protein CheA [Pseudomonadota bacterium]